MENDMHNFEGYGIGIYDSSKKSSVPVQDQIAKLKNGTVYGIVLRNGLHTQCDVELTVDGKLLQGLFRIRPYSMIKLERPADSDKCFTFKLISTHGEAMELTSGTSTNGLITAKFMPEKNQIREQSVGGGRIQQGAQSSRGRRTLQADTGDYEGGTCLTKHSDQRFVSIEKLDIDKNNIVIIHIRLVGKKETDEEIITPLQDFRKPKSTPIPPASFV